MALPEYLLIIAAIFYWGSAGLAVNPIAIGLILLLILQIIIKNKILGLVLPGLFIAISCYLLLALRAEYNEFPESSSESLKLLFSGLAYLIPIIVVSGVMMYKYTRK